jgi:fatty acid desaturase
MRPFELRDPVGAQPLDRPNALQRLGLRLINDPRDLRFLSLALLATLTVLPAAVCLYVPGWFRGWLAVPYLAWVLWLTGPFILVLHNTSHRPLFARPHRWLGFYIPWVLGPFFGETPETYFAHHLGMHHPENNLSNDLSTTMSSRRDSVGDFLKYTGRFFFLILFELTLYMWRTRRYRLCRRLLVGELTFYAVVAALMAVNWQATVVVFVVPFVVTRVGMMAGGWGQHAFVDPAAPGNLYRSSVTCINTPYNSRWFNDGYHIGHHLQPTLHWTQMPGELAENRARYAAEGAIVFDGLDFFGVWFQLMCGRYEKLAEHYVVLDGSAPSQAQVIALLRRRVEAVVPLRVPTEIPGADLGA